MKDKAKISLGLIFLLSIFCPGYSQEKIVRRFLWMLAQASVAEHIQKEDYFLLDNEGVFWGDNVNTLRYQQARDSLLKNVEKKYHFRIKKIGEGCVNNPLEAEYVQMVNQLMIASLNKKNQDENWYQQYLVEKEATLKRNETYLDSIYYNVLVPIEIAYDVEHWPLSAAQDFYSFAIFIHENPSVNIQIIVYSPEKPDVSPITIYEDIKSIMVNFFGIDGARFSYIKKNTDASHLYIKAQYFR